MRRVLVMALAAAVALPSIVDAQGQPPRRGQGRRGLPDSTAPDRAALEERVRQRFAQVLRNRLGLTDDQMVKVQAINQRYAERRRTLMDQERGVRMSLRQAIMAADSANQSGVSALLDRVLVTQRQRIDLLEQEQRDLSSVLTPLQRASYMGIEEQLRRGFEGMGGRGGRGPRRGPPPPP